MTRWPSSSTSLVVATLVAVLILGSIQVLTRQPIADARQQRTLKQLAQVLPSGTFDNDPANSVRYRTLRNSGKDEKLPIYTAVQHGKPVAFALETVTFDGYSGEIRLLLGITVDGTIIGTRVIQHRETPGLGDDIDHRKSDWIYAFNGHSITLDPTRWNVKQAGGEFDAFTGATITPRAVITAVHQALLWYEANQDWMIKP